MKRRIALALAMSMALSVAPMASFAASDNAVTKVVTIKADQTLENNAPVLKIENDGGDFGAKETIELELDNAEWLEQGKLSATVEGGAGTVAITRKSDSKVEIVADNIASGATIKVPLKVDVQDEGKSTVSISSKSGAITEGEYAFANVVDGGTMVTLEDTVTFGDSATIETLTIEESALGSIDVAELDYIKLELTDDFELDKDSIAFAGSLIADSSKIDVTQEDDNSIKLTFNAGALATNLTERGEIEISGLEVDTTKDSEEGTVYMTVRSNESSIKTIKLEVGKFTEYDVTVEADDDPVEIFSGRYQGTYGSTTDEAHELTQLNLTEEVLGSWTDGKTVTVEFPKEVKILNVVSSGDAIDDDSYDDNEFEFEITQNTVKDVALTFYVSVESGFEGDIKANIESRGLEKDYEVVLGKAVAPVKVETEVSKIKAGVRDQEIGKITITESEEESIKVGDIVIELDSDMEWDDEPTVEVVSGDLEIGDIEVDENILTITVDNESDDLSVIEITDGKVKVDRSIAEGEILAEIKGDALLENGYDKDSSDSKSKQLDEGKFSQDYYEKVQVANVITAADDDTTLVEPAKFVIGQKEYRVGDVTKTADVAPYIKDGRTMLSVRYVAESLGVEDNNIMWDGITRTVTIFKGDRIIQMEIGSNKLMVNGTAIMMDTAAEIKDGRTMLPVSFIAKALGIDIAWDGATRTVTIK
ncbi:MAG: copper amine oxidase N-terminal domain-containing protein [Anaeromicrobium sp.]|uniref:copper amine oxidase N-terminal domain-containing protein n=1 Tax=Anaeromicrobium sp. TaxID=1929132 RepID=UPI0025EF2D6E|nr:copper amine oxidase N-terminal domain-containing protein [Anaeromicrobium sp.]MCT4592732.1 copper amine oxidase N-terminal domain-containing protein [Anaeromicrobium sp.]